MPGRDNGLDVRANKLKPNPDNTEMLLVGDSSEWMVGVQPVLDGVALSLKEQVHSLGSTEPSLTLEAQVASVTWNAFYWLWLVAQLRPIWTGITWLQLSMLW